MVIIHSRDRSLFSRLLDFYESSIALVIHFLGHSLFTRLIAAGAGNRDLEIAPTIGNRDLEIAPTTAYKAGAQKISYRTP